MNTVVYSDLLKYRSFFWALVVVGSTLLSSCDPPAPTPTPNIAGKTYALTSITLNEDVSVAGQNLSKGADVTDRFKTAFSGKFACQDQKNTAFNLKENKDLYLDCKGESNSKKGGTWDLKEDDKVLSMTLDANSGLSKVPFVLRIIEVAITDNSVSGRINMPVPIGVNGENVDVDADIKFNTF